MRQFLQRRVSEIKATPEAKYSVWMIAGQAMVSLLTFFLTYILANYVSKEVVGEYRFILAVYSTISVFALYGLSTALMQSVASGKSGSIVLALKTKLRYGTIGSGLFAVLAAYYYLTVPESTLFWPLIFCALLLPLLEGYALYASYLQGKAEFKVSSIALTLDRGLTALAVSVVAWFEASLVPITLAYLLTHGLVQVILYYYSLRKYPPNTEVDEHMLPYAKHVTVMSIVSAVTAQLDKYILFFFFGPVSLALFWVASTIPQEVARVMSMVTSTFFPRFVKTEHGSLLLVVRRLFWYAAFGLALVCLLYTVLARPLFALLFPQYVDADGLSMALMFGFGFIPYYVVWQIFSAKRNVRALYYLSVGEPILTALLYITMIPLWGLWGITLALCVKTLVMNALAVWYLYRRPDVFTER